MRDLNRFISSMNESILESQMTEAKLTTVRREASQELRSTNKQFRLKNRVEFQCQVKNTDFMIQNHGNDDRTGALNIINFRLDTNQTYSIKSDGTLCDSFRVITNINDIISYEEFVEFLQAIDYDI